jgi:hypothetical protein
MGFCGTSVQSSATLCGSRHSVGQERECKLRYGGKTYHGKAYLETDYIIFGAQSD